MYLLFVYKGTQHMAAVTAWSMTVAGTSVALEGCGTSRMAAVLAAAEIPSTTT